MPRSTMSHITHLTAPTPIILSTLTNLIHNSLSQQIPIYGAEKLRILMDSLFSYESVSGWFGEEGYEVYVPMEGSKDALQQQEEFPHENIRGVCVICHSREDAPTLYHLHACYVHLEYFGTGIGSQMVRHVEQLLCERHQQSRAEDTSEELEITSETGTQPITIQIEAALNAVKFYEKLGYNVCGDLSYDTGDLKLMTKELQ